MKNLMTKISQEVKLIPAWREETIGSGKFGTLRCTYQALVKAFGKPNIGPSNDGKVTKMWAFKTQLGSVITVYDYKAERGNSVWSIGGKHWGGDAKFGVKVLAQILEDKMIPFGIE